MCIEGCLLSDFGIFFLLSCTTTIHESLQCAVLYCMLQIDDCAEISGSARQVKLRPVFWNKIPVKPQSFWARLDPPPPPLDDRALSILESLFPQAASTPAAKAPVKGASFRIDLSPYSSYFLSEFYASRCYQSCMYPCYRILTHYYRNKLKIRKCITLPI